MRSTTLPRPPPVGLPHKKAGVQTSMAVGAPLRTAFDRVPDTDAWKQSPNKPRRALDWLGDAQSGASAVALSRRTYMALVVVRYVALYADGAQG